jgi:peptidoglycan-associated lipoprotein
MTHYDLHPSTNSSFWSFFFMKNLFLIGLIALLSACASNVKTSDVPVEDKAGTAASQGSQAQSAVAPIKVDELAIAKAGPAQVARVVYFDFDSFVIKPEYQSVLAAHAKFMREHAAAKMAIAGHTDERGGREYNLALGQKRAEAVKKALSLLGVSESQLEAVSYGEEKPADNGNGEAAFAKNRRAELNYR